MHYRGAITCTVMVHDGNASLVYIVARPISLNANVVFLVGIIVQRLDTILPLSCHDLTLAKRSGMWIMGTVVD